MGFEKILPGFHQEFPAKHSIFMLLSSTEYYQYVEIALPNVG
jgi:hypothetical protein